jgi:GGDEF domain-containing protein
VRRMRFLTAVLIAWLVFFYNIERVSEPINLTSTAYIFVSMVVVASLTLPWLRRLPLWALSVITILLFVLLKNWSESRVFGSALPVTVTEICAIIISLVLTRWVSTEISEFERTITHFTFRHVGKSPESFSEGQNEIYREVRRARNHQRPLMLLVVHIEEESIKVAVDRMVQEVQQAMMKQYVLSGISKVLCDELEDYNIIAQTNNHFMILLPEITPENLPSLTDRLRQVVSERMGVTLRIGAAALPEDAVTFEGLTEKAIRAMDLELERPPQPQSSAAEPGLPSSS